MPNWNQIREIDFPVTRKFTYLDHAAGGVVARPVYEAAHQFWNEALHSGDFLWTDWLARKHQARKKIAQFIHAEPEEIAFVPNTSEGMNLIADLLRERGEVLASRLEFPASTLPWIHRGIPLRWLEASGGGTTSSEFEKTVRRRPRAKIFVTSYVQYSTGFRQDLETLSRVARKYGAHLVVNASQALGAFPIDVKRMGIDCLVSNSYKWMLAGYGGGIVFIRKGLLAKKKPPFAGWRSMKHPDRYDNRTVDLRGDASRYEYGGPPFSNVFAFARACEYLDFLGKSRVAERILSLTQYLVDELKRAGRKVLSPREPESSRSGIVIVQADKPEQTSLRLFQKNIFVTPRGGGIRVAPHCYNHEEDLDRLVRLLGK